MVYLTGDIHGDIARFRHGKLRWLSKKDTLIILGDFGFLWDGSKEEKEHLAWLMKRKYTILFLDGTHENFDMLAEYPCEEKFGGQVRHIGGNLYHACRGSILTIEEKTFLCMGGGQSSDLEEREVGVNWWKAEMPTQEEYTRCLYNLRQNDFTVDYILTHEWPSKLSNFDMLKENEETELHLFLDRIMMKTKYKMWYVARHHRDCALSAKAEALFLNVVAAKN